MILTVDGNEVYAYTGAREFDPAKPCIVFVHGGGLDHTVWLLQSRYFAHHDHSVLALDLPGHGKSGGSPLASIPDMADWIVASMDAAGVERAALVGHSMGTLVVLEAAARHPSRVERLVLIGTSVPMPVTDVLLDAARENRHAAFDMVNEWGHGDRAHLGGNQSPGLWMMGAGIRLLERSAPGVLYSDLKSCNDYTHGLESAARVTCPTHLILGREDRMSPVKAARALIETLADARVTVFDDCGHMLMAERPTEVLDTLIEALASPL